jgi:hypothetical protein
MFLDNFNLHEWVLVLVASIEPWRLVGRERSVVANLEVSHGGEVHGSQTMVQTRTRLPP